MSMLPHRLSQYQDGHYLWVVFCKVCSGEGLQLQSPCPGEYVEKLPIKIVDTDKEPS